MSKKPSNTLECVIDVSVKDILIELSKQSRNETFHLALDEAEIALKETEQGDYLELFFESFEQIKSESSNPIELSNPKIFGTDLFEDFERSSDTEMKRALKKKIYEILALTKNRLSIRLRNYNFDLRITPQNNMILELYLSNKDIKDPNLINSIERLIQVKGRLQFWETYSNYYVYDFLKDADHIFSEKNRHLFSAEDLMNELNNPEKVSNNNVKSFFHTEYNSLLRPAAHFNKPVTAAINGYALVGSSLEKDTAKVISYLNSSEVLNIIPKQIKDITFLWGAKPIFDTIWINNPPPKNRINVSTSNYTDIQKRWKLYAIKRSWIGPKKYTSRITDNIKSARLMHDIRRLPAIGIHLTREGARKFAKMTWENIDKPIAITLDNRVYTAPIVRGRIDGGRIEITGNFTQEEALELAHILNAGSIPVNMSITNLIRHPGSINLK